MQDPRTLAITIRYDEKAQKYVGSVGPQDTSYGYLDKTLIVERDTWGAAYEDVLSEGRKKLEEMHKNLQGCLLTADELSSIVNMESFTNE